MNIYHSIAELSKALAPHHRLVATLGQFDGIHLGHRHLIEATRQLAHELQAESLVITFDQHPLALLQPESPRPKKLASEAQKEQLMEALGVQHLLILPFTKELASLTAVQFVRPLQLLGLRAMVLGYDNRFGRKESHLTRQAFDQQLTAVGLRIERVEPLLVEGDVVSSSRIRALIASNQLAMAERLLGRPFSIIGRVQEGRRIGRTIGFPTANIRPYDPTLTLPEEGVYISEVRLRHTVYPAMSYYGSTPTITPDGVPLNRIEAYLLHFQGNLYGEELEIAFRAFIRPDRRFEGLPQLQLQLQHDAETTAQFFEQHPLALPAREGSLSL